MPANHAPWPNSEKPQEIIILVTNHTYPAVAFAHHLDPTTPANEVEAMSGNGLWRNVAAAIAAMVINQVATEAMAAPPEKDVCPAPPGTEDRNRAVQTACRFFDMIPEGWGLHSAFGRSGNVITCLHFSCRPREEATLREDCLAFRPNNISVRNDGGGRWLLTDGRSRMQVFPNRREAMRAATVIQRYRMNKQCFVGRPNPSMEYWLVGDRAPGGTIGNEDCIAFTASQLRLQPDGSRWLLTDGRSRMRVFPNRQEGDQALAILRRYGFNRTCYIGRPDPSMTYFAR